ncbi:trace amine-associated receptor 8a-like, partial [Perca flavescens]|uniref:trace amine-associated receptor 8a-like n=1 Tax=Perca flavescens TaxID=8167 RepID=UPI00106E63B9
METQDGAELCFPQLFNTSCRKLTPPWFEVMLIHILLYSISLLTVALNLLVIISVSHFRQLHTPTNILLLSLAVSDLLVGLVVMPGEILRKTSCWFLGDLVCTLYNYLSSIITTSSIGDIVLISVERYIAICDPLHYNNRITVNRVKLCVCLCWLYSVSYSFLFVKDDLTQMGSYCHQLKAARNLGVLVVVFLLCFCPYYSASYVLFVFYCNSCLNPVIYAFFYPWFRKSVKLIV